jgi:flagellar hook assembly protein FlgD
VQISIYVASGRVVSELANEEQVKGDHSVHWNGRDARGSMVSSGVYFVRLEANGETRTQKMVLLK